MKKTCLMNDFSDVHTTNYLFIDLIVNYTKKMKYRYPRVICNQIII